MITFSYILILKKYIEYYICSSTYVLSCDFYLFNLCSYTQKNTILYKHNIRNMFVNPIKIHGN